MTLISQFFAYIQMYKKEFVYFGELQAAFKLSVRQEKNLLSYLTKRSLIIRLKKGVYLVPEKVPPGGQWQPSALYLISCFMEIMKATYYIGGLYALNYYGFSEQIPNVITIYNDKISGKRRLGSQMLILIKIPKSKVGTNEFIKINAKRKANIASLERVLLDAVMDWRRYNTIPAAYQWIEKNCCNKSFTKKLVDTVIKYGNVGARRRIGYILTYYTNDKKLCVPIRASLKPAKGWTRLNPFANGKGATDKEWRVIDNVTAIKPPI